MKSLFATPFGAVFRTELLINSKRVAPYVLTILFTGHAVLWGGWSAAAHFGWATNSDFNIVRNFQGFAFLLGLPIFNAIIMGDPVIRDFRAGIDPLIFTKPISRAAYVGGKFSANFFVLVCCQSAFGLTLMLFQWFPSSIVLPVRVVPYFKHFIVFVVISHLLLAAIYFSVGALTRIARLVYGLASSFYPVFIAYQLVLLKNLPPRLAILLDPLLMNVYSIPRERWQDAAWINQLTLTYSSDMLANRGLVILLACSCLVLVYVRFSVAERSGSAQSLSLLDLSNATERVYFDPETITAQHRAFETHVAKKQITIPKITIAAKGLLASLDKLRAALQVEMRLLRVEKSLIVIVPLVIFLSILELAFYNVIVDVSYSATFAGTTARTLLFFLVGLTVFYTGEATHRDRELRVEPFLWSMPVNNSALLLSKFLATLIWMSGLVVLTGLVSILVQLFRGYGPVSPLSYLVTYSIVLFPSMIFLAAIASAMNVILRDKYVTYTVLIALAAGLFYIYSQGHNHWLYNPLMYGLWTNTSLLGGDSLSIIILHRVYVLALAVLLLSITHLVYPRKLGAGLYEKGWSVLIAAVSAGAALMTGLIILRR